MPPQESAAKATLICFVIAIDGWTTEINQCLAAVAYSLVCAQEKALLTIVDTISATKQDCKATKKNKGPVPSPAKTGLDTSPSRATRATGRELLIVFRHSESPGQ